MAIRAIAGRTSATPGTERAPIGIAVVAWLLALIGWSAQRQLVRGLSLGAVK